MAAKARYGFDDGSAQRSSMRTELYWPLLLCGMRMSAERLMRAQPM